MGFQCSNELKSCHDLLFFLLNTLHNIKYFSDQICYYKSIKKECLICKIKRTILTTNMICPRTCLALSFWLSTTQIYSITLINFLKQKTTAFVIFYLMNTIMFGKIGTMGKIIASHYLMQ